MARSRWSTALGIGAATAKALHTRGASIALVDLETPDAFDAQRTVGIAADVTDRDAIGNAVDATILRGVLNPLVDGRLRREHGGQDAVARDRGRQRSR